MIFQTILKYKYESTILLTALAARLIGINWDAFRGLHPDERMLVMVTEKVNFQSFAGLNTDFFNYGNFPIYLLKIISLIPTLLVSTNTSDYINLLATGRVISALFDCATTFVIYLLASNIWGRRIGLIAGFLYATTVFAIQNAHYFTVDTQLTFWICLSLYLAVLNLHQYKISTTVLLGITTGLAAATKITGIFLVFPVGMMLAFHVLQKQNRQTDQITRSNIIKVITPAIFSILLYGLTSVVVFFASQPYVLINFSEFWQQISLQMTMNNDATIFPYTLQFINTTPYLYPLRDIIQWGMGIPLATLAFAGLSMIIMQLIQTKPKKIFNRNTPYPRIMILLGFLLIYFLVLGRSEVKFMRYYLPLYPILVMFAAVFLSELTMLIGQANRVVKYSSLSALILIILVWPFSFSKIYTQPHSRIAATKWINENIPTQSVIAVEHWDDRVPLDNISNFQFETLEVYQPETNAKWQTLNNQLNRANYLVISSNRVYRSITNWPETYPITTQFYQDLFSNPGESGFELIKTFTNYPELNLGFVKLTFNDDTVQESFTSYDHPKVMIYARIR